MYRSTTMAVLLEILILSAVRAAPRAEPPYRLSSVDLKKQAGLGYRHQQPDLRAETHYVRPSLSGLYS